MPRKSITLDSVAAAFQQWRSTKKIRDKIPKYLWEQVAALAKNCKPSLIIRTLRISTAQYRQNVLGQSPASAISKDLQQPEAPKFVAINTAAVDVAKPPLIFTRQDGATLHYHCQHLDEAKQLITWFIGG